MVDCRIPKSKQNDQKIQRKTEVEKDGTDLRTTKRSKTSTSTFKLINYGNLYKVMRPLIHPNRTEDQTDPTSFKYGDQDRINYYRGGSVRVLRFNIFKETSNFGTFIH